MWRQSSTYRTLADCHKRMRQVPFRTTGQRVEDSTQLQHSRHPARDSKPGHYRYPTQVQAAVTVTVKGHCDGTNKAGALTLPLIIKRCKLPCHGHVMRRKVPRAQVRASYSHAYVCAELRHQASV